jgi:hypothetical protein
MNKQVLKLMTLGMLGIALTVIPTPLRAADSADQSTTETKPKKPHSLPFHGKLKAVDNNGKTISVGERTFQVTSETKIMKDDKPALLADGVVDQPVTGAYLASADGKLNATTINFGKAAKSSKKKEQ